MLKLILIRIIAILNQTYNRIPGWGFAILSIVLCGLMIVGGRLFQPLGFFAFYLSVPKFIQLLGFKDIQPGKILTAIPVFLLIFFITGELTLHLLYPDGVSFSNGVGPLVKQFYRNIVVNKYGSRGPEILTNKSPTKIIIQGDSFTWGQGIRLEKDIYTSVLKHLLTKKYPNVQIAVLAKRGREIQGHIEQLSKWAGQIKPQVIIYQWHITDIEKNNKDRPQKIAIPWDKLFFNWRLRRSSYFWFLLTYQIDSAMPKNKISYRDYIEKEYAIETENWQLFRDKFLQWHSLAKSFTPHIIILMPVLPTSEIVEQNFIDLAKSLGIRMVFTGKSIVGMTTSKYDRHPNIAAHRIIADHLFSEITDILPLRDNE